jgi:hypothetical protein
MSNLFALSFVSLQVKDVAIIKKKFATKDTLWWV